MINWKKGCAIFLSTSLMLLTGCQNSIPLSTEHRFDMESVPLKISLSGDAPPPLYEMVQELARRAEYFSEGALSVQIESKDNILDELSNGDSDLILIENSRLLADNPSLSMFELPYLFKNSQYMTSTMNSYQNKKEWSKLFLKQYGMAVEQVTTGGYTDMAARKGMNFSDFDQVYSVLPYQAYFEDNATEDLLIEFVETDTTNPLDALKNKEVDLCEISTTQLLEANTKDLILLESAHKIQPVYLLMNPDKKAHLNQHQAAALEEAIVRSAGYCASLYDKQRVEDIQALKAAGIASIEVNIEKYFSIVSEIYQEEKSVRLPFSPQFYKFIRSDACAPEPA